LKTRLILIEGIPGSGKNTTAEWLYQRLRRQDFGAELWTDMPHEKRTILL
jgi:thymidylate kinase